MYLEHFGLREHPFRITPHTDFFFSGAERGAILAALEYAALHEEGIIKVTGEVGSGKTMLCRMLMEKLPAQADTIYLANPSLGRDEILLALAHELGLSLPDQRGVTLIRTLQEALIQRYGAGRRVVLLVDEAHAMPLETLEEVRLLSNLESNRHRLLQIVLFGQDELNENLSLPNMRQLKERITQHFNLQPLERQDVGQYINFRLQSAGHTGGNLFSADALKKIAKVSQGLTRRINILADKALLAAFAENKFQVDEKHAELAIRDSGYQRFTWRRGAAPTQRPFKSWMQQAWLWAVVGLIMGGVSTAWFLRAASNVSITTAPATTLNPTEGAATPSSNQPANTTSTQTPSTTVRAPSADVSQPAMSQSPLTQALLAGQKWAQRSEERYALQLTLASATKRNALEQYLQDKNLSETVLRGQTILAYETRSKGGQQIGLLLGDFATREEALRYGQTLPSKIQPSRLQIRTRSKVALEVQGVK